MENGLEILKQFIETLPEKPGIYKLFGEGSEVLYIGKAKNLKTRVPFYVKQDIPTRLMRMARMVRKAEYLVTSSEAEAFLLEARQIKQYQPKYNILLKDDKSFPYIKLTTSSSYPQIMKYRGKQTKEDMLFGPFASSADVDRTINFLRKTFKIRSCTDSYFAARKRPCLQYEIKKCSAPCTARIHQTEYNESVSFAISFLKGKTANLQKDLSEKMEKYAEEMNFEKAAEMRDIIKSLSFVQSAAANNTNIIDADLIYLSHKIQSTARHTPNHSLNKSYVVESKAYNRKTEQRDLPNDLKDVKDLAAITVITIFFYRSGQNYGHKSYFPQHAENATEQEIISAFIGQFYQRKSPPGTIYTNIQLDDEQPIEQALFELYKTKTKIKPIKENKLKAVLDHIKSVSEEAFQQYAKNSAKSLENLIEVQKLFDLPKIPERIEIYDNSHIMGKFAIGAMVVAGPNGFEKNEYRQYTIHSKNEFGGNDYAMLEEVLERRVKRIKDTSSPAPCLMIIDGGRAHLNVALKLFEKYALDIPVIAMSKGEKRDAGGETFHTKSSSFTLDNREAVMKYLQILRDEVHNFAITSHRKKRAKAISSSDLDNIADIGTIRKRKLLNHFGSVERIKSASIKELSMVDGISESIARKIYDFWKI